MPLDSETKLSGFLDNFQDNNSSSEDNSTTLNLELNSSLVSIDDNSSVLDVEKLTESTDQTKIIIADDLENKDENVTQPDQQEPVDEKDDSGFLNRFKNMIPKKSNP